MKRRTARLRNSLWRSLWTTELVGRTRFRPRLESLEDRRLLVAAVDLAGINGLVFKDATGGGFTSGEQVANVQLDLYRDDGDGQFEPDTGDTALRMTTTDANGQYQFERLTAGGYFVLQPAQTASGQTLQRHVSPLITITSEDIEGRITTAIDTFDETFQTVRDITNDGVPEVSVVAAPEAIGGERDLLVNKTSVNGAVQLSVDDPLLPNQLTFDSIATGLGQRRVTWDGIDGNAIEVADNGLGGVNLMSADALGLQLQIRADLAGGNAIVRIYSDDGVAGTANRFSTATLPIPATAGTFLSAEFLPFSAFSATSGGGADFTSVGAIELEITGAADVNGASELVGAVGSVVQTFEFDNFESSDLRLTKTVNDATPNVGQSVTFTITVNNDGPDDATGVVVADVLPAGIQFLNSATISGNYDSGTGLWTIGSISDGGTASLTITGTVTSSGAKTNTAEVIAVDQADVDSTPNNSDPSEDDQGSVSLTTPIADLSLTKTVDNPSPNVNEEVFFTIQVGNAGPDPATGVVVTDLLPTGLVPLSSTVDAGNYNDATGIWTIGDVAVGANPTLTVRARVDSSETTNNTAQITATNQFDPNSRPNNNIATEDDQASVTVDPLSIDLSLTKTIDNSRPNVGDEVVYTITLSNDGPDTATGVTIADPVPSGLVFLSAAEDTGTYNPDTGIWTVPALPAGDSTSLGLRVRVDTQTATSNTAQVTAADQFDTDSTAGNNVEDEDDQATISFSLASADLSLTKTVNNATPNVGENVTFTIVLSNSGPDPASNISVVDQLPAGTTLVSATESAGNYENATGLWQVDSLAVDGSATLTIIATAETSNLTINTAEIMAADQLDPDSTPGNGAAEDDIATAQIQGQQIDLSLTKTISTPRPNVGEEVSFIITVRNSGPNAATGVTVIDNLPAGVTLVRSIPSQGSFNTTSRVWTVGAIGVDQQQTLELVTRIDQVLTNVDNTAEVIAANQPDVDSEPANNDAGEDDQASVTLSTPVADLSLSKTVSNPEPNVGEDVSFELILTNTGPDTATGVNVTDLLPSGVRFNSTSLSAGSYDPVTGLWEVGSLASGETATLNIIATVQTRGQKTNTARVTAVDQFDPDSTPGNNVESEDDQDSASLTPPEIDLSLEKIASSLRPAVGDEVMFTVTVRNAGPADASGVVVTDVLPNGVSFVASQTASGSYSPTTGLWNVGPIAAGASATLELVTRIEAFQETIANTAEVTAAGQFDTDSVPDNGDADEDDRDTVSVTPASADLSLTKVISDSQPNLGQEVTFTLTASNAGPDDAEQITVRDTLPTGLSFVSSTPSAGDYDASTGMWTIPNLAAGSSATLQVRTTVETQPDKINSAEIITSSQFDPDSTPANGDPSEDDQDSVSLSPQLIDLALTKMLDDPTPNVGDSIAYTLTLSNEGPSEATGVEVTDRLPSGVSFENFAASQGSYNSATGVWTVGSVAVGVTPTLVINATVGNTSGETNSAEVTAVDQVDIDSIPANNDPIDDDQDSVSFITQVADLSLTKVVDNPTPNQNDLLFFTLTLANAGPDNATLIRVQDSLPAGMTFVSSSPSEGNYDPVSGIWSLANLPASTNETLQIEARVTSPTASTNTAEVTSVLQFDPDSTPGNAVADEDDIATATVTPLVVDLAVSASVDNPEPLEGDVITLTFTTDNQGTTGATGVVVSVLIPDGLTVLSTAPQAGTYDPITGLWQVGALATGASISLVVTARVDTRGLKQIPVEVLASDQFDIDSTPGNDNLSEDDQTELIIRAPRLLTKRLFLSR